MMRFLAALVMFLSSFCSNFISAHECDPKNYVYDDEGHPLFVKVYLETTKDNLFDSKKTAYAFSSKENANFIFTLMQKDSGGSFIAVPIRKKTDSDDDDYWQCPYCGAENSASRNTCSNPDCLLYRKKGRNW